MIYLFSRCWTSYASRPITCCWSNFAVGRAIVTWISKCISLFHENISFASTKCSSLTEGCFDEMFFQNGRVKKRALVSAKHSFVIYILAQRPGFIGWAELQKMVK